MRLNDGLNEACWFRVKLEAQKIGRLSGSYSLVWKKIAVGRRVVSMVVSRSPKVAMVMAI
jgi:hypothetical protein